METDINNEIKTELQNAKVYAVGRGIGIDIKDKSIIPDIKNLVEVKLAH